MIKYNYIRDVKITLVTALHAWAHTWQASTKLYKKFPCERFFNRRPASIEKLSTSMKANEPASLKKKNSYKQFYRPRERHRVLQMTSFFFLLLFPFHISREKQIPVHLHINRNSIAECDFTQSILQRLFMLKIYFLLFLSLHRFRLKKYIYIFFFQTNRK